jgi:hypothetical protein
MLSRFQRLLRNNWSWHVCVCNLVWRQTMDIATHCMGSIVSKSAITNMAIMRNFEVIPVVSGLYLLQVLHKKYSNDNNTSIYLGKTGNLCSEEIGFIISAWSHLFMRHLLHAVSLCLVLSIKNVILHIICNLYTWTSCWYFPIFSLKILLVTQ